MAIDGFFEAGQCYCGECKVYVKEGAEPKVTAMCHCESCRRWGGGAGQLVTIYPSPMVQIEGELILSSKKGRECVPDAFSQRCQCAKCGSCVVNKHPAAGPPGEDGKPIGLWDVCGGMLYKQDHDIQMHCNYPAGKIKMLDGKPKFKNFPKAFGGDAILVDENDPTKEVGVAPDPDH